MKVIIVTGASGKLGSLILKQLLQLVPAEQIGATARHPDKAASLASAGIRVRHGDFASPDSLPHAFEGASQVLIVSSNAEAYGGDTLAQHRAAIDAARHAGARRVVYTSHMAASASSAFRPMHNHAATEAMLADSGIPWTALRNGFYVESGIAIAKAAIEDGTLSAPADGKVSWTAHADLAAAAAAILHEEGHDGPTPSLTGLQALDLSDLAGIASEWLFAAVERRVIGDETFRSEAIAGGVPEPYADIQLGLFRAARAGEFSAVDPTLAQLIGRAPTPIRTLWSQTLDGSAARQPSTASRN